MKKLQFDIVNIDIKSHHYQSNISKGGAVSKEKVLRLAQEQGRYGNPPHLLVSQTNRSTAFLPRYH